MLTSCQYFYSVHVSTTARGDVYKHIYINTVYIYTFRHNIYDAIGHPQVRVLKRTTSNILPVHFIFNCQHTAYQPSCFGLLFLGL